ncbi:FAD-dependent monooxygenase [Paenarthrobacter nicotinovorans]|uniref:FAD-dependent monooxygenase n=1 Tax=Paenarthrobacter nicotinovorans TaxID=29320 RepID=UPI003A807423
METDTIHFAPRLAHVMPAPWHSGRAVLIGDAAHAATPHIEYGAGLAVEDGVVLGDCLNSAATRKAALDAFTARRFDWCRMVVGERTADIVVATGHRTHQCGLGRCDTPT